MKPSRPLISLVVVGLLAGACLGDDANRGTPSDGGSVVADLSRCPDPLVIQTDWFPEAEHGSLYQLTRGEGEIDPGSGVFRGPLGYGDVDLTIEIRSGGPYIGDQPGTSLIYSDDSIFLGYVNTDEQIALYATQPTVAVVAPLEKNPQMIMFDPDTYAWDSWDDVKASGAVLNVFSGGYYADYLVGAGLVDADQVDPSHNGSPGRFIASNGEIAQQGFATQEPYSYEFDFTDWGRPVHFLLIHDSGWEIYSQVLAIRPDKLNDDARSCLSAFVPIVQQAAIDFQDDPGPVNATILREVIDLDSFWVLSAAGLADSVRTMDELGIVGNGPNSTLGDFDLARVEGVIDLAREVGFDVADNLEAGAIVTNEFIDPTIGR